MRKPKKLKVATRPNIPGIATPEERRRDPKHEKRVLGAYLAGPIAAALSSKGTSRIVWGVVALLSVAGVLTMLFAGSSISTFLANRPNGLLIWLILVPTVSVGTVTAWVAAIINANRGHKVDAFYYPRWLRRFSTVLAMGTVVPGLGLRFAGHPWRAALGFWVLGPLVASVVVLARGPWLWEQSRTALHPGISGPTLEKMFIITAVAGLGALLLWMIQTLDAARRVSTRRSLEGANLASVALILALLLGAFTVRPVGLAQGLHDASTALKLEGFRVIPLGLCEVAMRLDPAEPRYVAEAAILNKELGMTDAADMKRDLLEQRMNDYMGIVRRADQDDPQPMMSSPFELDTGFNRVLDSEDHRSRPVKPTQ